MRFFIACLQPTDDLSSWWEDRRKATDQLDSINGMKLYRHFMNGLPRRWPSDGGGRRDIAATIDGWRRGRREPPSIEMRPAGVSFFVVKSHGKGAEFQSGFDRVSELRIGVSGRENQYV
jgi:hypothetical protein